MLAIIVPKLNSKPDDWPSLCSFDYKIYSYAM